MDSFRTVPIELICSINEYAADWIGLESLVQVSPRVGALFAGEPNAAADPEAIRFVESILKTNSIMSHELHCQFRMVMKLHQPSLADTTYAEFMTRDYSLSSLSSSTSISRGMLRGMIAIAANIQLLACACLTVLLERLRAVQPRRWEVNNPQPWRLDVKGTIPYEPLDVGSPSWIEEYRVYRALWHLQLYSDLLAAGDRLSWPDSDLEYIQTRQIAFSSLPRHVSEELQSISECLERISNSQSLNTHDNSTRFIAQLPDASQLEVKFQVWSPPAKPNILGDGIFTDVWGQGIRATERNNFVFMYEAFQTTSQHRPVTFQACSLRDSLPFRALGMMLWDLWRLYGLGLWNIGSYLSRSTTIITTPDGKKVSEGSIPHIHGKDIVYRLSVFIQAWIDREHSR